MRNSDDTRRGPCAQWEEFITLLATGEDVSAELHGEWANHAAKCEACTSALARERDLLSLLGEHRNEPDASLLAACRAGLDDAIDRQEEFGPVRWWLGAMLPASWLTSGPAWSAAALLLLGFASGLWLGPQVLRRPAAPVTAQESGGNTTATSSTTSDAAPVRTGSSALAALDLHSADVAGISVLPSGGGAPARVELQLKAQQPVTMRGTIDDDNVKEMLLNILNGGDRYCPDVRLDAVEALRARNNDPEVRTALCHAVHKDHNAAVRLKALEALNGSEPQDIVQQTLLDALVDDQNPGVRVEAINALRDMASKGEISSSQRMISVLQDRMQKDANAYIRLQSAAAIRDLGPRGKF